MKKIESQKKRNIAKKAAALVLAAGMTASLTSLGVSAAETIKTTSDIASYNVIAAGDFNNWGGFIRDYDVLRPYGNGVYGSTIYIDEVTEEMINHEWVCDGEDTGKCGIQFKIILDNNWAYQWGYYEASSDSTFGGTTNILVEGAKVGEPFAFHVEFDTNKVSPLALANPNSAAGSVEEGSYMFCDISYEVLDDFTNSGYLYQDDGTYLFQEYYGTAKDVKLTNYEKDTIIMKERVFENRKEIESIVLPEGFVNVSYCAFDSCSNLRSVKLPSTIKEIGNNAFNFCSSLKSITIPENVEKIGDYTFFGCKQLRSIYISGNTAVEGKNIFKGAANLVIYGEKNSSAETYANENGIPFVSSISAKEIVLGGKVVVNAKAAVGEGYRTYAVLYKKKSDTKWTVKQNFGENTLVSITPAKAVDYDICVKAKDANGVVCKKFFTLTVNAKLANTSVISSASIKKGSTFDVNCSAAGGKGRYKYAVLYKKAADKKWTEKQNYKENAKVTIKPYAATKYNVCVKVKDDTGTIVKKYFEAEVN